MASSGSLTITRSTVSGNVTGAGGNGGAAGISAPNSFGNYGGNQTGGVGGGGGLGAGLLIDGPATLTNVTVSGNQGGEGGRGRPRRAVRRNRRRHRRMGRRRRRHLGRGAGTAGTPLLTHVTVATNFVGPRGLGGAASGSRPAGSNGERGEGAGIATGGRVNTSGAGITLTNSIVADNGAVSDANCVQYYPPEQYNDIADGGGNVQYAGTTCPGLSANPMLGPLGDNGGPTPTRLPDAAGAAIGVVPAGSCTVPEDQRGFARGGGSACDAGAVEVGGAGRARGDRDDPGLVGQPVRGGQRGHVHRVGLPGPIGGTVSFTDDGTTIAGCGAVAVSGDGQATCKATYGFSSSHPIVAQYSGNASFAGVDVSDAGPGGQRGPAAAGWDAPAATSRSGAAARPTRAAPIPAAPHPPARPGLGSARGRRERPSSAGSG